jgi:hypothetical protein
MGTFELVAKQQLLNKFCLSCAGTVVGGVHLELLVDHSPPVNHHNHSFWKVHSETQYLQDIVSKNIVLKVNVRIGLVALGV